LHVRAWWAIGQVAEVIAGVIERPRADVYTRDSYHATIAAYYSAESVELVESRPPFAVAAAPVAQGAASAGVGK